MTSRPDHSASPNHGLTARLPWLLCLVFPIGYLLTFDRLAGFQFEYFALTFISAMSCTGCLFVLQRPTKDTSAPWIVLLTLVGAYYLEFYEIAVIPWVTTLFPVRPVNYEPSHRVYFSCFAAITLAFAAFAVVACLFYGMRRRPRLDSPAADAYELPAIRAWAMPTGLGVGAAAFGALLLGAATSFVVQRYSLIMGLEQQTPLPLHLQGVIVYFRLITIPMMMIYVVYAGLVARRRLWTIGGIALLLIYALSDMILRASKGTLLIELLCLTLLWLLSGQRIGYRQVLLALGLGVVAVILFPVFEVFRALRTAEIDLTSALIRTFGQILLQGRLQRSLAETLASVTMRLTGAGAVMNLVARDFRFLGARWWHILRSPGAVKGYTTVEVFGAPPQLVTMFAVAPSLVGYFYVVDGYVGVVIGTSLFAAAVFAAWRFLQRLPLRSLVVAQVMFLFLVFGTVTEGTLDEQVLKVAPVYVVSVLLLETLVLLGGIGAGIGRMRAYAPIAQGPARGSALPGGERARSPA
jgi:hypothetical protein